MDAEIEIDRALLEDEDEDPLMGMGGGDPTNLTNESNALMKLLEDKNLSKKLNLVLKALEQPAVESAGDKNGDTPTTDDYLDDITQEVTHQEKRGPPINEKIVKIFQNMAWGIHKEEKYSELLKDILAPENIEGLEPNKVNAEVWRVMSHKTKSTDVKMQAIQNLLQKVFSEITYTANELYNKRSATDLNGLVKETIRKCVNMALLLGKANSSILAHRREKITPELNQSYKQLTFKQGEHPKYLFGDDLPKAMKDIAETNKVGYTLNPRVTTPNRQNHFLWKSRGHPYHHQYNQRGKPRQYHHHKYNPCQHQQPRNGASSRTNTITQGK